MSVKIIDDAILDIYVKKYLINFDFNDKDALEDYLKKLFKKLKNKYDITVEGFYEINVYIDKYYGAIFHLEKEELEYYDYFKNQVDMRLTLIHNDFLYEVEDIPYNILNKIKIIEKDNNIYIKLNQALTILEMMNLMENSKIVYNM